MPQDSSMFFTSVKNNIALSSQGFMKKIEESSLDAGAKAFIEKKKMDMIMSFNLEKKVFLVVNVSEYLWQGCFIKMLIFLS